MYLGRLAGISCLITGYPLLSPVFEVAQTEISGSRCHVTSFCVLDLNILARDQAAIFIRSLTSSCSVGHHIASL